MKPRLLTALAVGLLLGAGAARGDEQADAKALLDKAMKAMGGEAKLAKLSTATVQAKLSLSDGAQDITVTLDGTWQGMSQYRLDAEVQAGGQNFKALMIFNGDKGWMRARDKTEDAPEGVVPFVQNLFHAGRAPQLLPAFTGKDYKLSHLGEVKVGDRAAVGLSVGHKDRKDVSLFFDKENGLPLKCEVRLTEPRSDKELAVEYHFSDYKDFDGLKLPAKVVVRGVLPDGKEVTIEVSQVKKADKVDDGQFAKP
jgi:hypothetical protein